jgi:hypothetical protein
MLISPYFLKPLTDIEFRVLRAGASAEILLTLKGVKFYQFFSFFNVFPCSDANYPFLAKTAPCPFP